MRGLLDDDRGQLRLVVAGVVAYLAGLGLFYPRAIAIGDEAYYIGAALAFARGETVVSEEDPFTGALLRSLPSTYPPGTSGLLVPFVAVGGWRAAPLVSALCLCGAVLALARWLREEGRPPILALALLGYPPALVLGRHAMSDLPSTLIVTLSLWCLWPADRSIGRSALGGALAGASLLFRETNALFLAPVIAGLLLRRERSAAAVVAGGVLGVGLRLVASAVALGSPFFVRDPGYAFSLGAVASGLPLYLLAGAVMVPGGLVAPFVDHGRRSTEVRATTTLAVLFFALYGYSGEQGGLASRLVLGPRYLAPLVPLLALALAGVVARRERLERLVRAWAFLVIAAAFAVHPALAAFERRNDDVIRAIYDHTRDGDVIVANVSATFKFVQPFYGPRTLVDREAVEDGDLGRLLARRRVAVAVLDRSGSDYFEADARRNGEILARISARQRVAMVHEGSYGPYHVRVFDVAPVASRER
jgi:4-amino-4-deoxy-L-arabinose transferase-like glycosyltransferase